MHSVTGVGPSRSGAFSASRVALRASRPFRRGVRLAAPAILDAIDAAVFARGRDGAILTWNLGAARLYGYAEHEMIGQDFDRLVPPEQRPAESCAANACLLVGLSDSYETVRLRSDGSRATVMTHISLARSSTGEIVGVSYFDVERVDAPEESQSAPDSDAYLRGAFDDAPVAIALVSAEPGSPRRVIRVNRAMCELTGHASEVLETSDVSELLHPEDRATDLAAIAQLEAGQIPVMQLEQRLLHRERHAVWVALSASIVRDGAGEPLYCIRQLHDIEERKRYEGELGYLVEHDPLTGLLNRRGFLRELTHQVAYARRYGDGGSVLFLDLDDFKYVNDTLGHDAGDEVLSEVARIITGRLRETDTFARLGGDEFAVLLPHTPCAEASRLSGGLLAAVSEECCVRLADGRHVSMSIGVFDLGSAADDQTADQVVAAADDAMYAAKDAGKNRVAVAGPRRSSEATSRVTWAERVRRAVTLGQFEVYCQPIVDLASGEASQWELLLRLPGTNGELILPAQFLYTAERSGLVVEIDRWVLGEAIKLIASHRDAGRDVRLEVNISGRSVGDPALLELIERGIAQTSIDPANLVLEITETAAIANMDRARGFAATLQSLGCRFALDDFGAGFGSFYYLKHIPFDYVKIDGEFIRNLPASSTDQLIVDSIVQMSRGLGKNTIAEYVGDERTVETLREHGVDYGQGFHLGMPRPVSEALAA